ncbi:hypothetical protein HID58_052088 [Brassica napus]|uniref:N-acetyltransferase domain-containing protein n=1 Tax=Brassica napus TaxID=3708 RepID=A0ABQ8AAX5_BRANA|nr:hypothetical protein HID58_052088 [Brassica napus]
MHRRASTHLVTYRGYIAMLVVIKPYRGRSIGNMEVNVNNKLGALALYKQLSFIRAKRLYHYYLNGMGAFRLKLLFPEPLRIL